MGKILLFGGTSQIAARLIKHYNAANSELTVLTGRPWCPPTGVKHALVELSTYDGSHTTQWQGHYDAAVFIPPLILSKNILGRFTADRLVFMSSHNTRLFADSPSYAPYISAEEEVLATYPHAIILQPTMITGRGDDAGLCRLINLAKRLPAVPIMSATAKQQPIHLNDVTHAIITVLENEIAGGRYAIGGPDILTQKQLIHTIQQAIGRRRSTLMLPTLLGKTMARLGGKHLWAQQMGRASTDKHISPDHALPNFTPQVSFDTALALTLKEMAALENRANTP